MIVVLLFLVLGILIAEFLKLSDSKSNYLASHPANSPPIIGTFSRFLSAAENKNFVITWENKQKSIYLANIATSYHRQYTDSEELRINFEKLSAILKELAPEVKKEPVNAKLAYSPTANRLQEFVPAQNGSRLNMEASIKKIAQSIVQGRLNSSLVLDEVLPTITLNSLSGMGINALLARGESDFTGSSGNRIHNIKIGAEKFSGLILKPGEEFSFNNALGKVGAEEGYLAELVIKSGKLLPEYGGGICQVSTTLFRAAINSGLPILERKPHSFPVRYYNPQGFDATIYPGTTDLRFKNDTDGHVLIQNHLEASRLIFEIFGSSDGRKVELVGPQILEQNEDGSLKTVLTRKIVAADGTTKEDSFWSNYKSPASFPLERNPLE